MAPLLGNWDASNRGKLLSGDRGSPFLPRSILYVDAYDSFSYNVVAMLEETLEVKVTVMTIDSEWPDGNMIEFLRHYEAVVLGPGPGDPNVPEDVGIMRDIWNLRNSDLLPVLGICLGFQSLCLHYGVPIQRLPHPLHGQVRRITTTAADIFEHLPAAEVTLYHSLYANPEASNVAVHDLDFMAWLVLEDSGSSKSWIPMAVRHLHKPFWGLQFHPESCKSEREVCRVLLKNWWRMSLSFNKAVGRGGYGSPDAIISPHDNAVSFPDAAYEMLKWSASTSSKSASRTFDKGDMTAETINEVLNQPGSPTVSFQSNGRFTIISMPSPGSWRLEYHAQSQNLLLEQLHKECNEKTRSCLSVAQLWDALRYLMDMKKVTSGSSLSPFWGGFLGYFSYELGLACLPHSKGSQPVTSNEHSSNTTSSPCDASIQDPPDVSLLWCERSVVLDNNTGQVFIQSTRESDILENGWLDETIQLLQTHSRTQDNQHADMEFLDSILRQGTIKFPEEHNYKRQIEACKAELKAGESYELCLSCETAITLPSPMKATDRAAFPWKLYKRLKKYNPAAFSAYARLGDVKIVSSSPECFINWDRESMLEMKPMKGTVRKSPDMTMEKAREILGSTKEMAENLMIADLIRHDLYGICGSGGVHVEKLLEVEDHGRVFQMITHVKGEIRPHQPGFAVRHMPQLQTPNMAVHGIAALQRCLPPGSMTGAPKERSCMHLRTIEARKRGIYSGVMGYLDLGGGGSFSVMIRTAFTCFSDDDYVDGHQQIWRIGAGGAITILSTADGEWEEMLTKLRTVCNVFTASTSSREFDSV